MEVAEDEVPFAGARLLGLCAAAINADLSSPGPVYVADVPDSSQILLLTRETRIDSHDRIGQFCVKVLTATGQIQQPSSRLDMTSSSFSADTPCTC